VINCFTTIPTKNEMVVKSLKTRLTAKTVTRNPNAITPMARNPPTAAIITIIIAWTRAIPTITMTWYPIAAFPMPWNPITVIVIGLSRCCY
jgi:hypothetical protein